MPTPLATFTPSLVDPETLEKLFVAREPVLADLVARSSKAMGDRSRPHRLLIGPRGAGKTHLLTLAHHRISHLDPTPTVAWLPEDPWMIDGYADLLREIWKASTKTVARSPGELQRLSADELEEALRTLSDGSGPIIVLAENFDRILETIDTPGQRRLRRFLENDRTLLLLVTATRLTARLLQQDGPFYGFFSTHELPPLTVEQATDMLTRVAEHHGDEALATRLRTPFSTDRYRLAAIDALAGGQPRMWALLASALTVDTLDSLSDTLLTRFDDLTPYYQEQLGRLAPRERKVVRTLADADQALNVGEIADVLGVDRKSLAKTVSTLRREGWLAVVPMPLGIGDARKTYFELAEPLARLAFQLKDNRGEAVPMLVSFLSTWFSREQLDSPLEKMSGFVRKHLDAAVVANGLHGIAEAFGLVTRTSTGSFVSSSFSRRVSPSDPPLLAFADALAALADREPDLYLALPSAQRRVLLSATEEHGLEGAQRLCIELGSKDAVWIEKAERLVTSGSESTLNRRALAELYLHDGRRDAAIVLLDDVLAECLERYGPGAPLTLDTRLARIAFESWIDGTPEIVARTERLLADSEHALGVMHETTIDIRIHMILEVAKADRSRALSHVNDFLKNFKRISDVVPAYKLDISLRLMVFTASRSLEDEKANSDYLNDLLAKTNHAKGNGNYSGRLTDRAG